MDYIAHFDKHSISNDTLIAKVHWTDQRPALLQEINDGRLLIEILHEWNLLCVSQHNGKFYIHGTTTIEIDEALYNRLVLMSIPVRS